MAYIKKEQVLKHLDLYGQIPLSIEGRDMVAGFKAYIEHLPEADVVEVKRGYWIAIENTFTTPAGITRKGVTEYKCSLCGRREFYREPFCNCGAEMMVGDKKRE